VHQDGIDQHEGDHGQGERAPSSLGAPGPGGRGRRQGHGRGPQDRRLDPGQHGEGSQQRHCGPPTGREAEAGQQRRGDDEDEGDVLARDGEEVAEARGPEVVGGGGVLPPVVTEQDPGEESRALGAEDDGAALDGPTQRVQPTGDAPGRRRPVHLGDHEETDDVTHREVGPVGDPDHPAAHGHPVPGQRRRERPGPGRRDPGLEALGPPADVDHHLVHVDLGVPDQGDRRPVDGVRRRRAETGPGGMAEPGGEHERTEDKEPREA